MEISSRIVIIAAITIVLLFSAWLLAGMFGIWAGIFFLILNLYLINRERLFQYRRSKADTGDFLDRYQEQEENIKRNTLAVPITITKRCPDCNEFLIPGLAYCEECGRALNFSSDD
ncbi:MAG: hypothetical protein IH840_15370 [Candidatus Heimdallarchaeota archaeon]|nr:hypothetical protein [Candidatus Heimdallarchaeota archaeon]